MPGYRTHLMGGFTAYVIVLYLLKSLKPTPFTMLEWLACALVGALFPDVDTKSKGQLWFYRFLFLVLLVLALHRCFLIAALISIVCILPMLVQHRGLFHRPLFLIGVPMLGVVIVNIYAPACARLFFFDALFFVVGAMSHILLDRGVRAFV